MRVAPPPTDSALAGVAASCVALREQKKTVMDLTDEGLLAHAIQECAYGHGLAHPSCSRCEWQAKRDIALRDAARAEAFEEVCGRLLFDLPGKGLEKLWNAAQIPTPGEPLDHADLIAKAVVKATRAEQREATWKEATALVVKSYKSPKSLGTHGRMLLEMFEEAAAIRAGEESE